MTTLRFFQDEPCGVVLDLLYGRDLFIGYSCESSIAVVRSWRDHRRNELFCGTVRQERTDRGDSPECEKRSAAEATDVLFHWHLSVWSRCTPRYVTMVWKGMQLPPISADSQPTELIRTDEPTSIISGCCFFFFFFSVLSFSLLLCIHDKVSLIQDWMLDWAEVTKSLGVRDFCVISVLVIVTAVTCYDMR